LATESLGNSAASRALTPEVTEKVGSIAETYLFILDADHLKSQREVKFPSPAE
jgi:hypothetical protein